MVNIIDIRKANQLKEMVEFFIGCGECTMDLETESLDFHDDILSLQLLAADRCYYVPLEYLNVLRERDQGDQLNMFDGIYKEFLPWKKVRAATKKIMEHKDIKKIAHNMKFDFSFLIHRDIHPQNWYWDTMLAAWQLDENRRYGLKTLYDQEFPTQTKSNTFAALTKNTKYWLLDYEDQKTYACDDVLKTRRLCRKQEPEIMAQSDKGMAFFEHQMMDVCEVLTYMGDHGAFIDTPYALKMQHFYRHQTERLERIIDQYITASGYYEPINIDSNPQLCYYFYDFLGYKYSGGKKEKNIDKFALQHWASKGSKLARAFLLYRKTTALGKFIDDTKPGSILSNLRADTSRIHPNYNQHRTKVHRLSGSNPNTQNFPRKGGAVRECFIAPPGMKLLIADYSQIELRCFAHYSKDERFRSAYVGDNQIDLHEQTRANVIASVFAHLNGTDQRTKAKNVNFGIWYGSSAKGVAFLLGCSITEAQMIIDNTVGYYHQNKAWIEKVERFVLKNKYVRNMHGGYRDFKGMNISSIGMRNFMYREAVHFIICSTAACILKEKMIEVSRKYRKVNDVNMFLQIHDEIIVEVPESFDPMEIVSIMEEPIEGFTIPMVVDYDMKDRWTK